MEEKERYEYYLGTNSIKDNKTNKIYDYVVDLLNQQYKENQKLKQQLAITEKALELAVKDKCKFENALLSTSLGIAGGKVAVPKKRTILYRTSKGDIGE